MLSKIDRALVVLLAIALAAGVAATLAFSFGLLGTRVPIYGEAEVIFEASRIRGGLPLYVDPTIGAFDYGPVPSRWYVVYPPLWSWVVAHVPAAAAQTFARVACSLAWFGALAGIAASARRDCRRAAIVAACMAGSVHIISIFASSGRPDSIAIALAAAALVRSARRDRVDAPSAALFALAAWVKPNVLGLAAGALVYTLVRDRARAWPALFAGAATSAVVAFVLWRASHGAFLAHVERSLGQPLDLAVWTDAVWRRSAFALPIAGAAWIAWRARARLLLVAFALSVVWSLVSLAKPGSASNYWMETAIGAVAIAAYAPLPALGARAALALRAATLASAAWLSIASVLGVREAFAREPARAALVARARAICGSRPSDVVVADNPGIELAADGRVVIPAFQFVFLVAEARFPLELWLGDLARPEVSCMMTEGHAYRLLPPLQAALDRKFDLAEEVEGWRVYRVRAREARLSDTKER